MSSSSSLSSNASSRKTRASRTKQSDAAATTVPHTEASVTNNHNGGTVEKTRNRKRSTRSEESKPTPNNAHRNLTWVHGLLPCMWPCSTEDVASFEPLEEALRAHSDLSRESAFALSKKSLAKLVQSMREFQQVHLGPKSKLAPTQSWPLVRIPDVLFRDRSPDGPLFTILLSAFRHKHEWSWRSFDLASAKKAEENGTLFASIQRGLLQAGHLKHPVVYLDETVGRRRDEVHQAVTRMGGTVTTDSSEATHVVAHDEDVDAEHLVKEEERAEEEGIEVEKLYLKTLAIEKSPPPPPPTSAAAAATAATATTTTTAPAATRNSRKRRRGAAPAAETEPEDSMETPSVAAPAAVNLPPMAFVHWWYWPSSYDEWMVATDVDGEIAEEDDAGHPIGGPWVVSTKFVRDAARFNEWGSEDDYAIVDYPKKVALYARPTKVKQAPEPPTTTKSVVSRSKATLEKENKNKTRSVTIVEPDSPILSPDKGGATPERKKRKVSDTVAASAPPLSMTPPATSSTTPWSKTAPAATTATPKKTNSHVVGLSRTVRPGGHGMNPRQILTGHYGPSGNRLRRTVYDGALRVHPQASALLKRVLSDLWSGMELEDEEEVKELWNTSSSHFSLPAVGALPRPSQDLSLGTEIAMTEVQRIDSANNGGGGCKSKNRMIAVIPLPDEDDDEEELENGVESKRIRGGGGEEDLSEADNRSAGEAIRKSHAAPAFAPPPPSLGGARSTASSSSAPGTSATTSSKPKTNNTPPVRTIGKVLRGPTTLGPAIPPPAAAAPPPTSSSDGASKTTAVSAAAEVISLKRTSESAASRGSGDFPTWYDARHGSSFERAMLPEWFDGSAPHRTAETYVKTREEVMAMARQESPRFVTATTVRRSVAGDIGSLLRLHSFLTTWGLINGDTTPESKPAPSVLRQYLDTERRRAEEGAGAPTTKWTMATKRRLVLGVVTSAKQRRLAAEGEGDGASSSPSIDWESIAMELGSGISAADCQREFFSLPLDHGDFSSLLQNDSQQSGGESAGSMEVPALGFQKYQGIHELASLVPPPVLEAAVNAALRVTPDLAQAQQAAVLSGVAHRAQEAALVQEEMVRELLNQVMDQRMQKLENRVAVLDDLEGILEAERIALELERRDLYTTRCRHWFSGDH